MHSNKRNRARRLDNSTLDTVPRGIQNEDSIGAVLTRREVLSLFGAAGLAFLAGCVPGQSSTVQATPAPAGAPSVATTLLVAPTAAPTAGATGPAALGSAPVCVVRPAMTEGPYFVDEKLNRSDIRPDPSNNTIKAGAPLALTVRVSKMSGSGCTTLADAQVDIWHCDAQGVYSDVADPNFGSSKGTKFLRGYQVTDADGIVRFTTIYPGWYQGRAVHIHFKIRVAQASGKALDFTSQWFFDDALSDQVLARPPYTSKGQNRTRNNQDGIFRQGGTQLVLNVTPSGDGYAASFDIALQMG